MSDQSESERPRKRTKIVQTTLGFDAENDHVLLSNVLMFVASSKDLCRTRQVCRAFRKCSDQIASARTTTLIGGNIKPMIGQTILGLLHGAEEADDYTRSLLKEWNAEESRKEGFDLGLPTNKDDYQRCEILASVPCDPLAPGVRIPVRLQSLRFIRKNEANEEEFGTHALLPEGFFHINAYPSGLFQLIDLEHEIVFERNLNETLRRIQRDLPRFCDWDPFNKSAYLFYSFAPESSRRSQYHEYVTLCINVYSGYALGHPIPKLDCFQELVRTKAELREKDCRLQSIAQMLEDTAVHARYLASLPLE